MNTKQSFAIFDRDLRHDGDARLYEDWDFLTLMEEEAGSPLNWLEPVDYANGYFEIVLTVKSMGEIDNELVFGCGWWNIPNDPEIRHLVTPGMPFASPGEYRLRCNLASLTKWYGAGPKKDLPVETWLWDSAYASKTFYTLIQGNGNAGANSGFPVDLHVRMVIQER